MFLTTNHSFPELVSLTCFTQHHIWVFDYPIQLFLWNFVGGLAHLLESQDAIALWGSN